MKKIKNMFSKNDLFKIVLLVLFVTFVLSWIIPIGSFSGGVFTSSGMGRLGLADIGASGAYAGNFFLQQLFFVLFVGIFYGVLSKVSGYKAMVSKISSKFLGKEKVFVIVSSLIITLLTSFLTQTYVVLFFVPFVVNIASRLKLDKITTFLCSFGSILLGVLGATFGSEGLVYFIQYLSMYKTIDVTTEVGIRFGILALSFVVYHFFTLQHMSKVVGKKNSDEAMVDLYSVEEDKNKNVKVWPMALFFLVIFLFMVLGYVNWAAFEITIFDEFHTWLTELSVGKYTIISYILGNTAKSFGTWDLYSISIVLLVVLFLSILVYKMKFDDVLDNAIEGLKKMVKPALLMMLVSIVFVFVYWSPFTITISNWFLKMTEGFNPFVSSIVAAINSFFHLDFGYTGYVLGSVLSTYGDFFGLAFVIFVAINGLILMVAPTSLFLLLGLSYLDIPYKKWMKHIWKVALILLVFLLILFTLVAYI